MTKKVLVFTEMALKGSGYYYLMSPILEGMAKEGYDVKVIGLSYTGEEHWFDFSIIPSPTVSDGLAIASNIIKLWKPDVVICGLDIPLQISIYEQLKTLGIKYIAVTPLENPPLTQTWAAHLMSMDYVFFISELGKQSALKAGLKNVDHIQVAVTSPTSPDYDRNKLRDDLGIKDEFVMLTIADNQERKNLWANFEIVSKLKKSGKKVKFILVTREDSPVGYKLRDLALDYDINKETMIVERGLTPNDLQNLRYASDVYLSCSKAEGFGLPIAEAMSSNLTVVATDTGAITELLQDNRGYLIKPAYRFRDVWGNSWRDMIDTDEATKVLLDIMENGETGDMVGSKQRASEYVKSRTPDVPTSQMMLKIEEFTNE